MKTLRILQFLSLTLSSFAIHPIFIPQFLRGQAHNKSVPQRNVSDSRMETLLAGMGSVSTPYAPLYLTTLALQIHFKELRANNEALLTLGGRIVTPTPQELESIKMKHFRTMNLLTRHIHELEKHSHAYNQAVDLWLDMTTKKNK